MRGGRSGTGFRELTEVAVRGRAAGMEWRLAQVRRHAGAADLAAAREDFEDPWVAWNVGRTLASTAALACRCSALVLHRKDA